MDEETENKYVNMCKKKRDCNKKYLNKVVSGIINKNRKSMNQKKAEASQKKVASPKKGASPKTVVVSKKAAGPRKTVIKKTCGDINKR